MGKRFYCKRCAGFDDLAHSYSDQAVATLQAQGTVVCLCRNCGERVEIVDRPCEHKWYVPSPMALANCETRRIWRRCAICEVTQEGKLSVTWDA